MPPGDWPRYSPSIARNMPRPMQKRRRCRSNLYALALAISAGVSRADRASRRRSRDWTETHQTSTLPRAIGSILSGHEGILLFAVIIEAGAIASANHSTDRVYL